MKHPFEHHPGNRTAVVLLWLVVFISVLVSSAISWTHLDHNRVMDKTMWYLEEIHFARKNLEKGLTYVSLGNYHIRYSNERGIILIRQSLSSFEESIRRARSSRIFEENNRETERTLRMFESDIRTMRSFFDRKDPTGGMSDVDITRLRILAYDIEKRSDTLSTQISRTVREITKKHDFEFISVLWVSALLMAIVCFVLFMMNKSREESDNALRINRNLLSAIADNSSSLIYVFDKNGICLLANSALSSRFGVRPDEMTGKSRSEWMTPEMVAVHGENDRRIFATGTPEVFEEKSVEKGDEHTFLTVKFPLLDGNNRIFAVGGISTDITQRKSAENEIRKSLEEKDVLLRELYHRTKNNMQVIHSMLRLQSAQSRNDEVRNVLLEAGNKIMSMALVHQKLYQTRNLSFISTKEYVSELADLIIQSHNAGGRISLEKEIDAIQISIDVAIPLGLVINELLSNSMKHAFPDGRDGIISIIIEKMNDTHMRVTFRDNGTGVAEGFNFRTQETLGLRIIHSIVESQLKGKLSFEGSSGVSCSFTIDSGIRDKPRV